MRGALVAAGGAVVLAAVSTLGDFIWARWIPEHRPVFGLAHGTLLFLVLGLWLGTLAGRRLTGALGGAAIGFGAAAGYYALAPWLGASAMFAMWCLLWIAVAGLHGRLAVPPMGSRETLLRGVAAALASGLGFWAISGIWLRPPPDGPDYAWNLVAWSIAFLPGLLAVHLRRR